MKKFLFLILLTVAAMMQSCAIDETYGDYVGENGNAFIHVGTYYIKAQTVEVFYDSVTKVMYMSKVYDGGITMMCNADGSPRLYTENE